MAMTREQNEQLTRTGPGTLLGDLFRRYWIPALLAEEIAEPDGPPVRVQLLGEKLVAFRDTQGRIGLINEFCAHRGVSLWFGRNEECGLRCPYHGWKYDVNGQCVDLPSEAEETGMRSRIKLKSYPVPRAGRGDLDLHGAARAEARAAGARMGAGRARAPLRLQALAGEQLPAGDRRGHRFEPRFVPSFRSPQYAIRCSRRASARTIQSARPHAALRGRRIRRRAADRRPPAGGQRPVLLADHALHHAVAYAHPAAGGPSGRRPRLGADRRRELLGVVHQLSSRARVDRLRAEGDEGRQGHPREIRPRHLHSARQQEQRLPDGPRHAEIRAPITAASMASPCRTRRCRRAWGPSRTARRRISARPTTAS